MTTSADELSQAKSEADPWKPLKNRGEDLWDRVWSFLYAFLPVAVLIMSAYFIERDRNTGLGVFLIAGAIFMFVYQSQKAYTLGRPLEVFAAQRCSTILTVRFDLEQVLDHERVRDAFVRMQAKELLPKDTTFEGWRASLLDWYRERHKITAENPVAASVTFHFQSGRLRVNGKTQRLPVMNYEFLVAPVRGTFAGIGSEEYARMVRIRVSVLNGILRLQVGEWNKEAGYMEDGQKYSWMAWDTIASFPLVHDPIQHFIPPQYLLMEYFSGTPMHRPHWGALKREWERQDIDYRKALSTWGEYGENRVYARIEKKFAAWMAREGFKKSGNSWENRYMVVEFDCFQDRADMHRWLQDTEEQHF